MNEIHYLVDRLESLTCDRCEKDMGMTSSNDYENDYGSVEFSNLCSECYKILKVEQMGLREKQEQAWKDRRAAERRDAELLNQKQKECEESTESHLFIEHPDHKKDREQYEKDQKTHPGQIMIRNAGSGYVTPPPEYVCTKCGKTKGGGMPNITIKPEDLK